MSSGLYRNKEHQDNGAGGCGLLVLAALVWIIVKTWPWPLLMPPLIGLAALAMSASLRKKVGIVFSTSELEPDLSAFRAGLLVTFLVMGAVSLLVCLIAVRLDGAQWWLIPIILLAIVLRLASLVPARKVWSKALAVLSNKMAELLWITAVVLLLYSLALWRLQTVPLVEMTLDHLREWDKNVKEVHEWLERYKPGLYAVLVIQISIIAGSLAASFRTALRRQVDFLSKCVVAILRWMGRLSTAVAIAGTLTFLASGPMGLGGRITLTIRNANTEYANFQSQLADRVGAEMTKEVVAKAWTERPVALIRAMDRSASLYREAEAYKEESRKAKEIFGIKADVVPDYPVTVASPTKGEPVTYESPEPPLPTWSLNSLQKVLADTEALKQKEIEEELTPRAEASDEMSKKVLEALLPVKVADSLPSLKAFSLQYPVFGEFLDAIKSVIADRSFDAIKASIVKRITVLRAGEDAADVAGQVEDQAKAEIQALEINWKSFNESWEQSTNARFGVYERHIADMRLHLESSADLAQRAAILRGLDSLRETARLLNLLGGEIDAPLRVEAAAIQESIGQLASVSKNWPPLTEASEKQNEELARIYHAALSSLTTKAPSSASTPSQPLPNPTGMSRSQRDWIAEFLRKDKLPQGLIKDPSGLILFPDLNSLSEPTTGVSIRRAHLFSSGRWGNPRDAIISLQSYCDGEIVTLVAKSSGSPTSARLREIIGDKYDSYSDMWQTEVRLERERAERDAARKAEQERQIRESESRREEHYEHPVEVP